MSVGPTRLSLFDWPYLDDVIGHRADEAAVLSRRLFSCAPLLCRFVQNSTDEGHELVLHTGAHAAVSHSTQPMRKAKDI